MSLGDTAATSCTQMGRCRTYGGGRGMTYNHSMCEFVEGYPLGSAARLATSQISLAPCGSPAVRRRTKHPSCFQTLQLTFLPKGPPRRSGQGRQAAYYADGPQDDGNIAEETGGQRRRCMEDCPEVQTRCATKTCVAASTADYKPGRLPTHRRACTYTSTCNSIVASGVVA